MPRNGSGVYTLPPIYLATPGTTIQAQQHNDPFADVASALTSSVAADGQTPMTGNLSMGSNKITNLAAATSPADAVRFDQISDPTAAALAVLQTYGWAVTGNAPTVANVDATNIASGQYRFVAGATGTFPTGVVAADTGQIIMVRESVNEGSMIMAVGAGRIFWRPLVAGAWSAWSEFWIAPASTAQGSILYRGASGVSVLAPGAPLQYLRQNSGATAPEYAVSGARVMLASKTASASATLDFTEFNNAVYRYYEFELENVKPATDIVALQMRFSTNGGSSYDAGASDYSHSSIGQSSAGPGAASADNATSIVLVRAAIGNAGTEFGVTGTLKMWHAGDAATRTRIILAYSFETNTPDLEVGHGTGTRKANQDTDAVRFFMSSGNMASGAITMYGLI